MLQISVNDLAQMEGSRPENWGELLDVLENGEGAERRVVTAVRFGGVAAPTFRAPGDLTRGLRELGPIEVQLSTVEELLHAAAQAAFDSIEPLKRATTRIAAGLRSTAERTVARDLTALTSSIETLTTLTAALANAATCVEPHRADMEALVLRLRRLADDLEARQLSADWRSAATLLDRELTPTLDAWVLVARRVWHVV